MVAEQVKLIILSLRWILFRQFIFYSFSVCPKAGHKSSGTFNLPPHTPSVSYQLSTIAHTNLLPAVNYCLYCLYLWCSAQQGVEDSCRLTCKTYVWINVLTVAVTEFRLGSSVSGQAIYWFWAALLGGSICHLQDVLWLLHSGDGMRGVLFL